MRRAPSPASSPLLLAPCPKSGPPLARRALAPALIAGLTTLAAACAERAEPPVSREPAPASAAVPEKVAVAASSAAPAVALPPAPPPGSAAAAAPDPSTKKLPAAAIDVPRPTTPSTVVTAVASAAPVETTVPSAAPPVPPAPPVASVESPKLAEGSFNLWMQAAGKYTAGQQGAVQIVLVAKGAFHCNDKYPYKFKLGAAPAGVSYPQPIVRVESMSLTPARSVMTVPFVPSAPGDARIAGTFSFSVCSASSCQLETRELAINVKVD